MAPSGMRDARAALTHLTALTGPIVPAALWLTWRRSRPFAASQAAEATNFSLAIAITAIAALIVEKYVPLLGFVGTLTLWVIPVLGLYFCLAGSRLAFRGESARYPLQFKVVKTHD